MITNNKIFYFVVKILILYYWEEINQQISDPTWKAKTKKIDPKKIAKKGWIGGLSIILPAPITKKYRIPAIVSHIPLIKTSQLPVF